MFAPMRPKPIKLICSNFIPHFHRYLVVSGVALGVKQVPPILQPSAHGAPRRIWCVILLSRCPFRLKQLRATRIPSPSDILSRPNGKIGLGVRIDTVASRGTDKKHAMEGRRARPPPV